MNFHVTKRSGEVELFSENKYKSSLSKTFKAAGLSKKESDDLINQLTTLVNKWLSNKPEVSTKDIYSFTLKELNNYNKFSAIIYKKYREVW